MMWTGIESIIPHRLINLGFLGDRDKAKWGATQLSGGGGVGGLAILHHALKMFWELLLYLLL